VPPRTGRAAVEIVGDVANFGADVERSLNSELRSVDVDVSGVARQISDGIGEGVETAKAHVGGLGPAAKTSLGGIGEEADKAGQRIGDGVRKGTDQARDELGRFVKLGASSGAGFALGFGGVTGVLGGIGKAAGKALSLGIKTAAAASAVNTAAGLVVALAPAVGAIGALAPAFIASKIAAGAFQLSMMGVSDALEAGITGDTEAFNEALKAMPPAAQAAMKEIVGLKKEILAVRETVQGNFFAPLVGQLKPLGDLYLPLVSQQLGVISGGFGKAAAESSKWLQMPASVYSVATSLGYTSEAVNNVTAGVPGLVRAFLPLWEIGSSFLPGLTYGFDDVTQKLGEFMERAADSGRLEEFISGGLSVLGELGQILGDVGSILMSVFQGAAAAGGDLLGVVGTALSQFAAFLNTAQGMAALEAIFSTIAGVAGLFGQALAVVLPIVAQLITVLAGALQPLLPIIGAAIAALAPVVAQVGQALGAILGPAIGVVVQLLGTLIPVILPIIELLIANLMPVIQALAPVITILGQVISNILGAALRALMPLFATLLPVISKLLTSVLTPLVPILGLVGELFMALMPALEPLIVLAAQLLDIALVPLSQVIPVVADVLTWLIKVFIAFVEPVARAIGWVAKFLSKLLESHGVKDRVVGAFNTLKSAVSAAISWLVGQVQSRWNALKSALQTISGVVSAVIAFFGRLKTGATNHFNSLVSWVRGIPGKIKSALGSLSSLLTAAGRNVIQGLINGITSKLGALRSKAASAASTIRNLFPFSPAKEGPLSGSGSPDIAGGKIADMIAAGLERQIPAVRRAALDVADASRLSTRGLDVGGRGILADALGSRTPTAVLPPSGGGGSIVFQAGAISVTFQGAVPTADEAFRTGEAVGRGLASTFAARDVRTTVRTI
jgi:phage-related protein